MNKERRNVKLTVAYEGTDYLGWQKTKEGPSIEEALQRVLEKILQRPVALQAASRTDAGVHALGQVVNFYLDNHFITKKRLLLSCNSLLPATIRILSLEFVPENFHPTTDCIAKEYQYWICNSSTQLPQNRSYSWHIPPPLNLKLMSQAAAAMVGKHNYAAFCNALQHTKYENTVRNIEAITLTSHPHQRLCIAIRGERFLYCMVRNMVGTLVDLGRGKIAEVNVEKFLTKLFTNGDRTEAGVTAPAKGLTLYRVLYETGSLAGARLGS